MSLLDQFVNGFLDRTIPLDSPAAKLVDESQFRPNSFSQFLQQHVQQPLQQQYGLANRNQDILNNSIAHELGHAASQFTGHAALQDMQTGFANKTPGQVGMDALGAAGGLLSGGMAVRYAPAALSYLASLIPRQQITTTQLLPANEQAAQELAQRGLNNMRPGTGQFQPTQVTTQGGIDWAKLLGQSSLPAQTLQQGRDEFGRFSHLR